MKSSREASDVPLGPWCATYGLSPRQRHRFDGSGMTEAPRLTYWDAACFTWYINGDAERLPHLQAILDEVQQSRGRQQIATSVISKIEVAFSVQGRELRAN